MSNRRDPSSQVVLVVLDGWGYSAATEGNAIELATTPVWHKLWHRSPRTLIEASGRAVGLPEGQMGNSEVGHLNLGAGRVVPQDIVRIDDAIATGEWARNEALLELCRKMDREISRATVYRTLTMLEDAGFVEGLDTGDGGRKFEHVLGHRHHDHMVCNRCGAIIEFFDEELERRQELAASQHGFTIQRHSLKLFGVCRGCREREEKGVTEE